MSNSSSPLKISALFKYGLTYLSFYSVAELRSVIASDFLLSFNSDCALLQNRIAFTCLLNLDISKPSEYFSYAS